MSLTLDTPLTRAALGIARRAHAGQFRHDGITPYISHPIAVANYAVALFSLPGDPSKMSGLERISTAQWHEIFDRRLELLTVVGCLHDVAEGGAITERAIIDELTPLLIVGLDDEPRLVYDALHRLNRLNHPSSYLLAVIAARGLWLSSLPKQADLWHNLQGDIPQSRREKYILARYILETPFRA